MALSDLVVRSGRAAAGARSAGLFARRHWQDAVAFGLLLSAAVVIDRDLLTTGDYPSGEWGEWLGHAYRVKLVQEYGLPTWDHAWTGGISPFQTYQFVPHVVTAIVASLANASIGRTMLVLEGCLIFWVRSSGYVTARMLGLPPAASLLAGVITFGVFNYEAETLTFSTLWGLALTPLLLVAAWRYRDAPQIHLVAAAAGLSIYVHPHVALAGLIALIAAFLAGPLTRERTRSLALQGAVFALAAAFFWMPAVFSAKPPMQDPESANVEFLRRIFDGNVDRVNDLMWVILPVVAIAIVVFWRSVQRPLLRYVTTFFATVLFLIAVSYAGVGPESVRLVQGVRLLNLLPLGLGLMAAIAIDAALREAAQIDRRAVVVPACAVVVACLLFVPTYRFAAHRSYQPAWYGSDPLADWFEGHDYGQPGRVWMEGRETSWYTFRDFGKVHSARSAFPQGDWSLLARPLQEGMLVGDPGWPATEDYLKAMAVSYVLVPDNTPASHQLGSGDPPSRGYLQILRLEGFPSETLYKTPWEPVEAFVADAATLPSLDFPRARYKSPNERATRDRLTHTYADFAYSNDATSVNVEYPSGTTMRVHVRDVAEDQALVISENWDRTWRAETSDGKNLNVSRYGPSYIRVDISRLRGDVVIELHHGMSRDWKLGIALTLLSLPVAAGLTFAERWLSQE